MSDVTSKSAMDGPPKSLSMAPYHLICIVQVTEPNVSASVSYYSLKMNDAIMLFTIHVVNGEWCVSELPF